MIELYLLEQLLAFQECGTLSGASEKLHISQPALSRSMRKLEELLGVSLFERQKNKIILNENGVLATEYAAKMMDLENNMIERIRAFDRTRRTIAIGSCAPAPITAFTPLLSQFYPDMTIATDMRDETALIRGLKDDIYQFIVLTHPIDSPEYSSRKWKEEHLFVTLPPAHPLAERSSLHLKDLNGQTMLLYSQLGFWHDLCVREMPDTHFLIQNEHEALTELVMASALPAFVTNMTNENSSHTSSRINIPILDAEANVTYYCIYKTRNSDLLSSFLQHI